MIFIYTTKLTPRLKYISEHIFKNVLGAEFLVSEDKEAFFQHSGICINYSKTDFNKGVQIEPHGLLSETGIQPIPELKESNWDDLFCFFFNGKNPIPFDLFAASFYLLTLYEEYSSMHLDEHSRFFPEKSLAYRKGFLEIPMIDRWAYKLKDILIEKYNNKDAFKLREYRFISTYDIDHPYLYKNKGIFKNMLSGAKDAFCGKWNQFVARIRVLAHLEEDPYLQSLIDIELFHKKYNRHYYLFVLLAGYGKYGRSTLYPQRKYFNYLKSLTGVRLGLHSSYNTWQDSKQMLKEKRRLETILKQNIELNRQHYLRMQAPTTFRILNDLGFKEDFTLSYSKMPGFRSATAIPHLFFDLEKNECSSLLIRPTIVMDSCLIIHLEMSPEEALKKMNQLALECKRSGGDFLVLWHNSNLAKNAGGNPWVKIFIESFQYAVSLESDTFGAK